MALEDTTWNSAEDECFPGLTFNLTPGTIINAGGFESVVPSNASAMIDIRLMPTTSVEDVLKKIDHIVNSTIEERNQFYRRRKPDETSAVPLSASITIKNKLPAARIDSDHPLVLCSVDSIKRLCHQTPTAYGCGPANEGYMLIENGIPTICGFGPIGGNAHGIDEWISIPSMNETVDIYFDIVKNYCQLI